MPARDDFGSGAGRPGGYGGGAGGLGNGGIGGGMGGGFAGGGAGRNGGIGSRTGLTTGNRMLGGMAMGRPGGPAMNPGAWGMSPTPQVAQGPLSGVPRGPRPASVPGVNPVIEDVPMPPATPNVFNQNYLGSLVNFRNMMNNRYGWGAAQPGPGPAQSALPANLGLRVEPAGYGMTEPFRADSFYNDPKYGFPSGGGGPGGYTGGRYGFGGGGR